MNEIRILVFNLNDNILQQILWKLKGYWGMLELQSFQIHLALEGIIKY